MKTIKITHVLMAFLLIATFIGCTKEEIQEQEQENCLVGTWKTNTGYCATEVRLTFASNGTGTIQTNNCPSACTDGADYQSTLELSYTTGSSGITITGTRVKQCNEAWQTGSQTLTETFTCDNDVLVFGTLTYLRQ